jgi:hypothetical protein
MLNFAIDHLPVFINVARPSTACSNIILSPLTRTAIVKWNSGSVSAHPCRRRDMLRLMFVDASMGQWANRTLLQRHESVTL